MERSIPRGWQAENALQTMLSAVAARADDQQLQADPARLAQQRAAYPDVRDNYLAKARERIKAEPPSHALGRQVAAWRVDWAERRQSLEKELQGVDAPAAQARRDNLENERTRAAEPLQTALKKERADKLAPFIAEADRAKARLFGVEDRDKLRSAYDQAQTVRQGPPQAGVGAHALLAQLQANQAQREEMKIDIAALAKVAFAVRHGDPEAHEVAKENLAYAKAEYRESLWHDVAKMELWARGTTPAFHDAVEERDQARDQQQAIEQQRSDREEQHNHTLQPGFGRVPKIDAQEPRASLPASVQPAQASRYASIKQAAQPAQAQAEERKPEEAQRASRYSNMVGPITLPPAQTKGRGV